MEASLASWAAFCELDACPGLPQRAGEALQPENRRRHAGGRVKAPAGLRLFFCRFAGQRRLTAGRRPSRSTIESDALRLLVPPRRLVGGCGGDHRPRGCALAASSRERGALSALDQTDKGDGAGHAGQIAEALKPAAERRDPAEVSTPEQNCIVFRSKNASIMPTRMASSMGSSRGRQAWVGSSDDGSALLRRERRLL